MNAPDWRLVESTTDTGQIPGRPEFTERRVRKKYRAALDGISIYALLDADPFECVCGAGEIQFLDTLDGTEVYCSGCSRKYVLEMAVLRIDAANIPPPGI